MKNLSLKIYLSVCMLVLFLRSHAQTIDIDGQARGRRGRDAQEELDGMDSYMDYQPLRFGIDDVIMVVLLLVACYVFGKIWKGCSYLLLIFAALVYYLTH